MTFLVVRRALSVISSQQVASNDLSDYKRESVLQSLVNTTKKVPYGPWFSAELKDVIIVRMNF